MAHGWARFTAGGRRLGALLSVLPLAAGAAGPESGWLRRNWREVVEVAQSGETDLHLSGVYWHLPFAYSAARRERLNDAAWGLGFGRSRVDARDNERVVLAQVSRSSHHKPQYVAGTLWTARWRLAGNLRAGAGYAAFVFARSDVFGYLPMPGLVPVVSLGGDSATLYVTYLPRIHNAVTGTGNVLYAFARIRL